MGLGQVQDAAQEQETYSQQEQGEQDSNEASSLSTTICANNEAPLTPMDLSGVSSASFSLSNTDSRSHDLGSGPNDRMLSTVQPEISLRSTEPNGESSSRDTTAQEISPGVGTERAQCDLVQFPASPSTSLSLDMARDLDSWLGFVPFEESIFNFFPLSDNYFDGSGLNVHAAAESQQLNGSLLSAQFDLQQLGDVFTQQHQLPAMARNLFPRLDHDASRWLTTKPSVSNFDRTIVNRFLNLFFAHVPSTFTSFESFSISGSTNEEEVLAAASFGGLYCTTRGSLVIARALCSDARRLFLTRIRTNFPLDIAEKIRLLRPMLLLELFGICSGDKRLCELTEAFHVQFLQDFQLLECYRTTLLQMLPYLYPGMSIFSLVVESSGPKELKMIDIVNKLLSPTEPRLDLSDAQTSTTALASLLVLSYHASPSRSVTSSQSEGLCLWDKRFFESGLDAWLRSHTSSPDVSILLLFHIGKLYWNQWAVGQVPSCVLHLHMRFHTTMIILFPPPHLFEKPGMASIEDFEICYESLQAIFRLMRGHARYYHYQHLPLDFVHTLSTTASTISMKRYLENTSWDEANITRSLALIQEAIHAIKDTHLYITEIERSINNATQGISRTLPPDPNEALDLGLIDWWAMDNDTNILPGDLGVLLTDDILGGNMPLNQEY
ncbi:hypothetical protein NW762_013231 [Fusarium torreyae]|uniref:Transcription factor domain-containing protein n=1 Tax=Fusarium torreyae TaxID=1237075 RepID=A0A9W8RNK4_9HYPO|nr:hypothetical protein NW762_013231 [Fusarium torreyae]